MGGAVRADPDDVVAGGVDEEHIVRRKRRETERIRLVRGLGRAVDRIGVRGLVGLDIEHGLDRPVGGILAIEDEVAADAPAGAVGGQGDVDEVERVGDLLGRSALRALDEVLQDRTGRRPVGAL